ncbi:ABC transporter ATP-binding protein [Parasporobacterium paucivorans]|uniref:Amino acid/amide ABC transporter ATP-binding protein 1, HAAT family n=1 Tax=Parasporobacterium paucivorans DSM 15970 TaxID=1122934 RepID=A0A1M6E4X8_9FIRM|nr:ATP-binding cassette domain-containing protein [Parasporobacterium paucivorans]SHI80328.1 amino acid/amide ABC transporter ATP-binding protein 1, HAAT family [Parasporobacterium paucivorans DSM 15970]
MEPILKVEHLAISFGNNQVLKDVNFELEDNETLGVIGPNGAGKTVMLDLLTGILKPTAGKIIFMGQDITHKSITERVYMGLGRTFQVPRAFEKLTAYENVMVGGVFGNKMSQKAAGARAEEILELIGLTDKMTTVAGTLGILNRKRLEIGIALASKPKVLLFDEVAGGLTETEIGAILDIVATLKKEGYSIVWIEHVIQTMMKGTDRVLLLAEGKNVICGEACNVMASEEVERVYLGVKKK